MSSRDVPPKGILESIQRKLAAETYDRMLELAIWLDDANFTRLARAFGYECGVRFGLDFLDDGHKAVNKDD